MGIPLQLIPNLFRDKSLCTSPLSFLQAGECFKVKTKQNNNTDGKTQNCIKKSKLVELTREIEKNQICYKSDTI